MIRLNGSGRTVAVKERILFPTSISIDHANGRLYWADLKLGVIETMTLSGMDRRVVRSFSVCEYW